MQVGSVRAFFFIIQAQPELAERGEIGEI